MMRNHVTTLALIELDPQYLLQVLACIEAGMRPLPRRGLRRNWSIRANFVARGKSAVKAAIFTNKGGFIQRAHYRALLAAEKAAASQVADNATVNPAADKAAFGAMRPEEPTMAIHADALFSLVSADKAELFVCGHCGCLLDGASCAVCGEADGVEGAPAQDELTFREKLETLQGIIRYVPGTEAAFAKVVKAFEGGELSRDVVAEFVDVVLTLVVYPEGLTRDKMIDGILSDAAESRC